MGLITSYQQKAKALKTETYTVYLAFKNPMVPWYAKVFIILIVGYALSPIDLIPDFIPVLGYVDDLSPIYEKASIAIAPIYIGSGARLKIVEAMMYSTLNITSPKGAEGLLVEDGRHIVIAIDRQAWISKILFYLDNKRERVVIEKNAYDLVEKEYYYAKYKQVIERCIGNRIDHLRYSE